MADIADLLAQKADIDRQVLDAIAAIQAIRAAVRAGRPLAVAGDAFVVASTTSEG